MNTTSDSRFTDEEFASFKDSLQAGNARFPSKRYILQKLDDVHALLATEWTEANISYKIKRVNAMRNKFDNYGRDRITRRREEASKRGDEASVARFDHELMAYDAGSQSKPLAPSKGLAQQERLAQLNRANREANKEEIRKAQIAHKQAQQKLRDEAIAKARKREAEAAEAAKNKLLQVPGKEGDDLFGDGSEVSRAATPVNGTATPKKGGSRAGTPMNGNKERKPFTLRKKNIEDDVLADMDLGIDIDI